MPGRPILLLAVTALFVYLCWTLLQPFVQVLLWAAVLVIIFQPVHRFLLAKTGHPNLSAWLAVALEMLTVVLPLLLVGAAVAREAGALAAGAQDRIQALLADPAHGERLRRLADLAGRYVDLRQVVSGEGFRDLLAPLSQALARRTLSIVGGALGFLVSFAFVIFTMFYLFRDGRRLIEHLPEALPLDRRESERLLRRTTEIIHASIYGILVIAFVQGLLGTAMFFLLAVPSALVWGVLMMVACTIPMAGSFLVWLPVAVFLALTGHPWKALILAIWGALVIGMADNLLRPVLVGRRTRMHELLVFLSVLGGLRAFGVLGILFGPVVVAVALALLEVLRKSESRAA